MTSATPGFFEELNQTPENTLVEKAVDAGGIPVGYTCSYVPDVLLTLGDLFPLRVRAPGAEGTEIADIYMSTVICSYTRSLLEFAMDDRYEFLKGWVFAAGCDHLRRLCDNLDYLLKPEFNLILDVPHKTGEPALKWQIAEINRFLAALGDHFGVDTSQEALKHAVTRHNRHLEVLRRISDLRKTDTPPISGTDFHRMMTAYFSSPRELIMPILEEYEKELQSAEPISDYRARLLLLGGQMDNPDYIASIESTGALVVADRICTGAFPYLTPIPEEDDPVSAIAEHSLCTPKCPRMMEAFRDRTAYVQNLVKEFRADGVVLEIIKFCDVWGVEMTPFADELKKAGIPVLAVEREYRHTGEGQLKTRVQAFLESMDK